VDVGGGVDVDGEEVSVVRPPVDGVVPDPELVEGEDPGSTSSGRRGRRGVPPPPIEFGPLLVITWRAWTIRAMS
jgi:hypothetical protein